MGLLFSSNPPDCTDRVQGLKENKTALAEDIEKCLSSGVFYHDKPLEAFKGLSNTEFVFDDESQLRQFLSLSDARKAEWKETSISAKTN